jgi:hypothetical protein
MTPSVRKAESATPLTWSKAMTNDDDDATCDFDTLDCVLDPDVLEHVVQEALAATAEATCPWPNRGGEQSAAYFARKCQLIREYDPRLRVFLDEELYDAVNGAPFCRTPEHDRAKLQSLHDRLGLQWTTDAEER